MNPRFLDVAEIEELQRLTIVEHGGAQGLRDRGLLESAVARAENVWAYEDNPSTGRLAATLAWGLIKNHAFIDGNKRIGLAALLAFLRINNHRLACDPNEAREMVLNAAAGEVSETLWTAWVEQKSTPLG